jgi:mRNA-degrading endonuclease RelE of RelBE toxin-antitoxin system
MSEVREKVLEILKRLDETELRYLSEVLRIEKDNLYLSKPRVTDDMLRAVREIVK